MLIYPTNSQCIYIYIIYTCTPDILSKKEHNSFKCMNLLRLKVTVS